jgi:4-hydroxybenzoate polyprenyltransferase
MTNRWWTYQRERFPLLAHGPLILAFSFSAVSFSSLLRGREALPTIRTACVAFGTALLFFLQLRISDEFKDFEEDARFRPYRPVPRGLVTLRELGIVGIAAAGIQLGLALWLDPRLAVLLILVWLYLGLMSKEFFARDWIKARPITYMWTHMLIIPLIDLYATACDWFVADTLPPQGLIWFLVVSFFNGIVVEIGRKIRAPEDEEHGVETYSVLWGRTRATLAWFGAMLVTAVCAGLAAYQINFLGPVAGLLIMLLAVAAVIGWRFVRQPITTRAKPFEPMSGVWTLLMYLSLGAIPLFLRL